MSEVVALLVSCEEALCELGCADFASGVRRCKDRPLISL